MITELDFIHETSSNALKGPIVYEILEARIERTPFIQIFLKLRAVREAYLEEYVGFFTDRDYFSHSYSPGQIVDVHFEVEPSGAIPFVHLLGRIAAGSDWEGIAYERVTLNASDEDIPHVMAMDFPIATSALVGRYAVLALIGEDKNYLDFLCCNGVKNYLQKGVPPKDLTTGRVLGNG